MKRILIFICGVQAISWGLVLIMGGRGEEPDAATSAVISLIAFGPLMMAVLLRLLFKESWADAGLRLRIKGNLKWYAFALGYPLVIIGIVFALAVALGAGELSPDRTEGILAATKMTGVLFVPMFFAGIGEEFGWRGYLEPNLQKHFSSPVISHIIVGIVWGVWHFPILMLGQPDARLAEFLIVVVGCIALAVIYGQLKIRTHSVWPCVLLHAFSNTFTMSFAISQLLVVEDNYKKLISLSTTSVAFTGIWIVTGLAFLVFLKKPSNTNLPLSEETID